MTSTTKEFIEKAINIHGDTYGYDRVIYDGTDNNVWIYCKKCKKYFQQTPHSHLIGRGCRMCGIIKRSKSKIKTTEQFIIDAIDVHGDLYGYDKVIYEKSNKAVWIYCKKCKKYFSQTPNAHLCGKGCRICAYIEKTKKRTNTKEEFIEKAIDVHGDTYGYDRVIYKNNHTYVLIYCKKCKKYFPQQPNNHLLGQGCNECGINRTSEKLTKTLEQFIIDSHNIHGDLYGYNRVIYDGTDKNVWIYCKKCKKYFPRTPNAHLSQKQGCPICRESKGEKEISKILDVYDIYYTPQKRFNDCRNKKPLPFDFFLPEYDVCIEYQGEHHYESINFNGKMTKEKMEENFKSQQKRDKIKKDYCLLNNITLIEIPYWDFDDIESILLDIINTYKEVYT